MTTWRKTIAQNVPCTAFRSKRTSQRGRCQPSPAKRPSPPAASHLPQADRKGRSGSPRPSPVRTASSGLKRIQRFQASTSAPAATRAPWACPPIARRVSRACRCVRRMHRTPHRLRLAQGWRAHQQRSAGCHRERAWSAFRHGLKQRSGRHTTSGDSSAGTGHPHLRARSGGSRLSQARESPRGRRSPAEPGRWPDRPPTEE